VPKIKNKHKETCCKKYPGSESPTLDRISSVDCPSPFRRARGRLPHSAQAYVCVMQSRTRERSIQVRDVFRYFVISNNAKRSHLLCNTREDRENSAIWWARLSIALDNLGRENHTVRSKKHAVATIIENEWKGCVVPSPSTFPYSGGKRYVADYEFLQLLIEVGAMKIILK